MYQSTSLNPGYSVSVQFPANVSQKRVHKGRGYNSLPPTVETHKLFLAPGFKLAEVWLLTTFREIAEQKVSHLFAHSHSLSLSLAHCSSAFQVNGNKPLKTLPHMIPQTHIDNKQTDRQTNKNMEGTGRGTE